MQALDLAIRNFAVAEHLLHLEQLFADAAPHEPSADYVVNLCAEMEVPEGTALHHLKNSRALLGINGSVTVPSCLTSTKGLDFLLRQAVVVGCSALESFVWDILRENALTVIKARGRKADSSLKEVTLTLDDYLSLEGYTDPDERLKEIILKRFERGTLYDSSKIDEIMKILTVRDLWKEITEHSGLEAKTIRSQLTDLILRRNQIAHRADRPEDGDTSVEPDPHGLRPITHGWVNTRLTTAKTFVEGASSAVERAMEDLERIISQKEEQRLAQQTMQAPPTADETSADEKAETEPEREEPADQSPQDISPEDGTPPVSEHELREIVETSETEVEPSMNEMPDTDEIDQEPSESQEASSEDNPGSDERVRENNDSESS